MAVRRIPIVDDDSSLRRVTQVQLGQFGYEVIAAVDGAEALAMPKEASQDVVVADLNIPGMSA